MQNLFHTTLFIGSNGQIVLESQHDISHSSHAQKHSDMNDIISCSLEFHGIYYLKVLLQ